MLSKNGNYYPQVFLKECKYIEKTTARFINGNFSNFSCFNKHDEKQIKVIKLMTF